MNSGHLALWFFWFGCHVVKLSRNSIGISEAIPSLEPSDSQLQVAFRRVILSEGS
jgi:hypothetical protein